MNKVKKYLANIAFIGVVALNPFSLGTLRESTREAKPSIVPNIRIQKEASAPARLKTIAPKFKDVRGEFSATVTAINSSSIIVNNNGTSIQVDISAETHFRRKFWGNSSLSEISVGDSVEVIGKWTSDAKNGITAKLIRDKSIQKRKGVFFGTVKSLTSSGFVVTTIHKEDQTVTFGTAKIIDRKEGILTQEDIKVGDKIRIKGVWNSTAKTITETIEIKNFSLPLKTSPSATPITTQ